MDMLIDEKSVENEAAPATQAALKETARTVSENQETRRISGSPTAGIHAVPNNLLVSELEDNGECEEDNDSVAAPVSEIPQEDGDVESDYEYEYEDDDDAAFGGFLMTEQHRAPMVAAATAGSAPSSPARIEEDGAVTADDDVEKPKWKEPSREAVDMSLRAERETSGGKRRLAQDLYKIMMADTNEAGFSLEPTSEDSMEKWTIKLFAFDKDSSLHKDMLVLGLDHIELEMTFPDQYPFAPPFVRVVRPRFKRQTGFVMSGALCMELLTTEGWNPVNDIESVIVSIRSLLVVGDGRLSAAAEMSEEKYKSLLTAAQGGSSDDKDSAKRARSDSHEKLSEDSKPPSKASKALHIGSYSRAEAESAYTHLSSYHKEKGWDMSGWWARQG